jgi:hypothetical protein
VAQLSTLGIIYKPMKKFIIIGFVVAVVAVGVLLWQHSKYPSDAELARQIAGAWTIDTFNPKTFSWTDPVVYTNTISPDGSFSCVLGHRSALVTFQGTWLVKDGEFVITYTNSYGTGDHQAEPVAGKVDHHKIIHVDEHQFIYMAGERTNTLTR